MLNRGCLLHLSCHSDSYAITLCKAVNAVAAVVIHLCRFWNDVEFVLLRFCIWSSAGEHFRTSTWQTKFKFSENLGGGWGWGGGGKSLMSDYLPIIIWGWVFLKSLFSGFFWTLTLQSAVLPYSHLLIAAPKSPIHRSKATCLSAGQSGPARPPNHVKLTKLILFCSPGQISLCCPIMAAIPCNANAFSVRADVGFVVQSQEHVRIKCSSSRTNKITL